MGKVETVVDFIFLGSRITADNDCSHEIRRHLLLGKKAMINLDSILKSRDIITLQAKVQSYGFSSSHVWMWELDCKEGWVLKNWCFRTVVLEKSPLDSKEIKPVNFKGLEGLFLNILWKDWCWNWNSNTLATWCEELTHWKRPWCWERLRAGGEGNDRGWDGWMTSPTQWMWVRANSGRQWRTRKLGVFQSMGSQRVRHNWVTGPQLPSPPPSSES